MKLDDLLAREEIRHVIAKCTTSGDRLRIGELVACFTPDGSIESENMPEERAFRYQGREAIRAWQDRWLQREGATHGATFVRHHLSTSTIELTGHHEAETRTYWVAWTDIGPDHAGIYLDRFSKLDGEWLIAHRRVRLDWEAEGSLFKANATPAKS